jgi:hypothetical protein
MLKMARLERRNFEARVEEWLDTDMQGAWRVSPDVSYSYDKREKERIYGLCTSAASAFIAWLRARNQDYEASIVRWRFEHAAPVPMLKPSPTATVSVLPSQQRLFD